MEKKIKDKNISVCMTTYFDKNFEKIGNICLKTLKVYAKKYGLDIRLYNNIKSNRPPAWNKILLIQKLLQDKKDYDFVLWIDSDALIINFDKDIREEIESAKDLYLVKHFIKGREVPNTGSFLIRNSEWSRKFLADVWDKKEHIYNKWWENAAVNELLGFKIEENKRKQFFLSWLYKLKIKNIVTNTINHLSLRKLVSKFSNETKSYSPIKTKIIESRLNKIKWLDKKWNSLPGVSESPNPIVNHYPAKPFEERLILMQRDLDKLKLFSGLSN